MASKIPPLPLSRSLTLPAVLSDSAAARCSSPGPASFTLQLRFSISTPISMHNAELFRQLLRPSFKRSLEGHPAEIRDVLLEI